MTLDSLNGASTEVRASEPSSAATHRVVIVGGGAGGLELATRLGRRLEPPRAEVVLVDSGLTHLWKPLLHEVAAGSIDLGNNEIDYLAHARQHGFQFHLGRMAELDRAGKQIWLEAMQDEEGQPLAPRRALHYDTLVIAVGSQVNDFQTPGVREHALLLNTVNDAQRLHKRLFATCLRLNEGMPTTAEIAIIGGGATGVELAAELHDTLSEYERYADPNQRGPELAARITLIEANPSILSNLPYSVRDRAAQSLKDKGVRIMTGTRVEAVTPDGVRIGGGQFLPAQMVIWAAGVKAPEWLTELDGLPTNKLNQLLVKPTLQTTVDDDIFAFGDCASCTLPGHERPIPPLAQAAHQQAHHLARSIVLHIRGQQDLPDFVFHDHGSLISLGPDRAVGSLIGRLTGRRFFLDGAVARFSYWALYHGYLSALHGWLRMALATVGNWLTHSTKSRVKLH